MRDIHLIWYKRALRIRDHDAMRLGFVNEHLDLPSRIVSICAHEETTGWLACQRDRAVRRWCRATGIALREVPQTRVIGSGRCIARLARERRRGACTTSWGAGRSRSVAGMCGERPALSGITGQAGRYRAYR